MLQLIYHEACDHRMKAAQTAPLMTQEHAPHNLPASVSSFVGREDELRALRQHVGTHRLVTLTGAGGTGKTRLALEAAASLTEQFADGVWLVELAGIATPDLVAQTIARVFTLPEIADRGPLDQLGAFLQPRHLLLVLDNCEHLIAEAAQVAATLLAGCPRQTLLATSREPLAIPGEALLRVPPLRLPNATWSADPSIDPSMLLRYSATQLFAERAHAAEPQFQLTASNAAAVLTICRRLDGIPLALELAAGQLRGVAVASLADRLHQRFSLIMGGNRVALARHQTLHAMIDWSYGLLGAAEQMVVRRLGVFAGDFTLDAAEYVCAAGARESSEPASSNAEALFSHLLQLVNKSLVQYNSETGRYRLLETIRLFCLERLAEAGEAHTVSTRHLGWYLQFAEAAAQHAAGPKQAAWGAQLEAAHDNLRAALAWAIHTNQAEHAARLALGVWRFWHTHTYQREGQGWLENVFWRWKRSRYCRQHYARAC